MSELEPSAYSDRFAERLRGLGVDPVLIGGLAANVYRAEARFTTDVDFLTRTLRGVTEAFAADGLDVRVERVPGSEEPYVLFARGDGIRVDVLVAETEFQLAVLERAQDGTATAEDVIVFKLLAWRQRDQDDVRSILSTGRPLDVAYIEGWAAAWEVADRWTTARSWIG